MNTLAKLADNRDEGSLATKFRRKRFCFFRTLLASVPRPLAILDVGGTEIFWEHMGFADEEDVEITILNLAQSELMLTQHQGGSTRFFKKVGDARSMPEFGDGEFDVVFSNSVLEHVGSLEDQQRMIDEVRRVGKRFFVQTPNFFFPVEPHFHVFGFQFLPVRLRVELLCHFSLGWTERVRDRETAEAVVRSVRLLTRSELERLCPDASIYTERVFGIPKSFVAYGGFKNCRP